MCILHSAAQWSVLIRLHVPAMSYVFGQNHSSIMCPTIGHLAQHRECHARSAHAVPTQCARSAKFCMSVTTRTLVLALLRRFVVP